MGNCLSCFKEPPPTALDSNLQHCRKEEMPDSIYSAPSHVPTSVSLTEATIISNGNHLTAPPDNTTTTNIFYQCQKRVTSKSAPLMGTAESKTSDHKLNALFDVYKDDSEDAMLPEGIEKFCKDLQVCPEDFKILVLAWKLNAEQMCRFTRTEFVTGLKLMRVDSIKGIQQRLPEIASEIEQNPKLFKDLYRFTFRFGLDVTAGQRSLPTEMAVLLWKLVFTIREPPILVRWLKFLECHQQIRGIPRDTWNMFLNFSEVVGDDLSCYDDAEAWPSLFDDFVEYENDQANQNISKDKECDGLIIEQND